MTANLSKNLVVITIRTIGDDIEASYEKPDGKAYTHRASKAFTSVTVAVKEVLLQVLEREEIHLIPPPVDVFVEPIGHQWTRRIDPYDLGIACFHCQRVPKTQDDLLSTCPRATPRNEREKDMVRRAIHEVQLESLQRTIQSAKDNMKELESAEKKLIDELVRLERVLL